MYTINADFAGGLLQRRNRYTMHADLASGLLQLIESGTPTWPPIRIEGRKRSHAGAAKTLANAAAWAPARSSKGF